jgi:hypothetical protein
MHPINLNAYAHTPLAQIGRVIRWHEELATYYTGRLAAQHRAKANALRATITALFLQRFTAGDYAA